MTDPSVGLHKLVMDVGLTTKTRLLQLDRVWLALGLLFALLAMALPVQAIASVRFVAAALLWIAPYLLLSVVLAAWIKAAGVDRLMARILGRAPLTAILAAAVLGALSPFCSCGVVPLVAALLAAGMPLPAVMAFWISSPLMDPEQFILMVAAIGLGFTLAKTVAAMGLAVLAGLLTLAAERLGWFAEPLRNEVAGGCATRGLEPTDVRWAFWTEASRRRSFAEEAGRIGLFLAKWLTLAFLIESLMVAWMPPGLIAEALGGQGWQAIVLATVIGVPAYLNGFAAIPLVGELMTMGMAPAAALSFLVAGGVTSIPAAMAVYALVRRSIFVWYLVVALLGSLAVGYSYQAFLQLTG